MHYHEAFRMITKLFRDIFGSELARNGSEPEIWISMFFQNGFGLDFSEFWFFPDSLRDSKLRIKTTNWIWKSWLRPRIITKISRIITKLFPIITKLFLNYHEALAALSRSFSSIITKVRPHYHEGQPHYHEGQPHYHEGTPLNLTNYHEGQPHYHEAFRIITKLFRIITKVRPRTFFDGVQGGEVSVQIYQLPVPFRLGYPLSSSTHILPPTRRVHLLHTSAPLFLHVETKADLLHKRW